MFYGTKYAMGKECLFIDMRIVRNVVLPDQDLYHNIVSSHIHA